MILGKLLTGLALVPVIYLGIAGALILSQRPVRVQPAPGSGLDFSKSLGQDFSDAPELATKPLRDGETLGVRHYGTPGQGPLLILVHGSGWHGLQFHDLAKSLGKDADVLVPDLRGHGAAPGRRGDVDYIGQYEDDLADLIVATKAPNQKVIVVGHSSGGGLVVRMAGGKHGQLMDRAILLAPFLKHDAPTMRPNSGGWTRPLTRRLIGLSMLNQVGITSLNHLTAIQFAMPHQVLDGPLGHTATTSYSFRLNSGYAPRNAYTEDIAALPDFILIAGAADEAFDASQYAPLMSTYTGRGAYEILPEVGHLDVVNDPRTAKLIKDFLNDT